MNNDKIINTELLKNFEDVLTAKEVMQILKISKNCCYELLQNNTITSVRVGNQYRIPKINVIKYLQNC